MRIATLTLLVATTLLAGCGTGSDPEARDGFAASRELVEAALDAWKDGRTTDLTADGRPLRFEDEDAQAGLKLTSYEVREPPDGWTEAVGLAATLSLRDAKGRRIVRHAEYRVTRGPDLMVSRED